MMLVDLTGLTPAVAGQNLAWARSVEATVRRSPASFPPASSAQANSVPLELVPRYMEGCRYHRKAAADTDSPQ